MTALSFCHTVIDGNGPYLDRFFTYRVPLELSEQLQVGHYVKVPWGQKERGAVVHSFSHRLPPELSDEDVKLISGIADPRPVIGPLQWKMVEWLRGFYFGTWSEALRCLLPGPVLQGLRKSTKARKKKDGIEQPAEEQPPRLTGEQEQVWGQLQKSLAEGKTFLLQGVTGSGKTELYLRATAHVLHQGRQAIVLVPEVALTPQTQQRYRSRFGSRVCILHSGLTDAQRRREWWRIRDGEAAVVVGTRSAIFAPVEDCGLIVLDEEHDSSYKQGSDIRYHARQVAAWLSRETKCSVILGSATPSLESYALALGGRYQLLELHRRVSDRPLPEMRIVQGRGIPHQVLQALAERKAKGEQSVVLLNRRGFSNYLQCNDCGWVPECTECSISLTYHKAKRALRCHYCGAHRRAPDACPECGSHKLEYPGRGTERVEQELSTRLPELRVARLDRDTVGGRSQVFSEVFSEFASGGLDCLLGTQMVAKGLDFPRVTLVVVLQADTGLHLPDFRANERTFSLLTQVAGRAGRGEEPGEVLLVCSRPQDHFFHHLLQHRWKEFMAYEQELRRALKYPPYARLLRLILSDEKEERLEKKAQEVAGILEPVCHQSDVELLGPAPCPLERLQGRYRWHIILRALKVQDLQNVVRNSRPSLNMGKTRLSFDPDPLDLL